MKTTIQRIQYTVLMLAMLVGMVVSSARAGWQTDGPAILHKIHKCSQATSYRGIVKLWYLHKGEPRERIHAVTVRAPDRAWIERIESDGSRGRIIVRRNEDYYVKWNPTKSFIAREQGFSHYSYSPGFDGIGLAMENYHFHEEGQARILGRPATILRSEPDVAKQPSFRTWVDEKTGLILKQEKFKEGRKVFGYEFTQLEINPEIPEELFNITVVNDSTKHSYQFFASLRDLIANAGFPVQCPKWVPAGYMRQDAKIIRKGDTSIAHLLYSNGVSTLSFFQRPVAPEAKLKIAVGETRLSERHGTLILRSRSNIHLFTLVGELNEEQMRDLMGTVMLQDLEDGKQSK